LVVSRQLHNRLQEVLPFHLFLRHNQVSIMISTLAIYFPICCGLDINVLFYCLCSCWWFWNVPSPRNKCDNVCTTVRTLYQVLNIVLELVSDRSCFSFFLFPSSKTIASICQQSIWHLTCSTSDVYWSRCRRRSISTIWHIKSASK
jgi:hypothetical protein